MANQSIVPAALIIAAAIIIQAFLGNVNNARYLVAAGPNQTAWRIDTKSGRISMCGSVIDGSTFSQLDIEQDKSLLASTASKEAATKAATDYQNARALSHPHCSAWAAEE